MRSILFIRTQSLSKCLAVVVFRLFVNLLGRFKGHQTHAWNSELQRKLQPVVEDLR